jgi:hypothetical protein
MKKLLPLFLTLALSLWAADFWQSKPYTDWSDKDVQKLLSSSPWAKEISIAMTAGGGGGAGKGGGKKGGGGGGDVTGDSPISGPAAGGGGGSANRAADTHDVGPGTPSGAPTMTLTLSWRTALPVREAVAKQKFGADAATSADAKKIVEEPQKSYAILMSGLPGRMLGASDRMKSELMKNTSLIVKGKDPIMASDIQTGGNEKSAAVLFLFPKTSAIDLDDKEVEFSTKVGQSVVKQKFKLKDMVFNGKLEL